WSRRGGGSGARFPPARRIDSRMHELEVAPLGSATGLLVAPSTEREGRRRSTRGVPYRGSACRFAREALTLGGRGGGGMSTSSSSGGAFGRTVSTEQGASRESCAATER